MKSLVSNIVMNAVVIFTFATNSFAQDEATPVEYYRPKNGISLFLDKNPEVTHRAIANRVRFLPYDKNLLVATYGNTGEVVVWNYTEKRIVWRKKAFEAVYHLEVSKSGKFIFVTGKDGRLLVLDSTSGKIVTTVDITNVDHWYKMNASASAPVLVFQTGLKNRKLNWKFYSEENGQFEFGDQGEGSPEGSVFSYAIAASSNGSKVGISSAFTDGGKLIVRNVFDIYDTDSAELSDSIVRTYEIGSPSFSPNGDALAYWGGPNTPEVLIYDFATKQHRSLLQDIDYVNRLVFINEGKDLCVSAELTLLKSGKPIPWLQIADIKTAKLKAVISPSALGANQSGRVGLSDFAFSEDGKMAAFAISDGAYSGEVLSGLPDVLVFEMPQL